MPAGHISTFISSLHYAWPTACDNAKAFFGQSPGYFDGEVIIFMASLSAGRTEYGYAGAYLCQGLEALYKFSHNFKNLPTGVRLRFRPVAQLDLRELFFHFLSFRQ